MNIQHKWLLILLVFGFVACESDDDVITEEPITAGEADFTKFVSLGNSLTAGFTDNALFIAGQENSMPNIMAQQFALAEGGAFTQPLMSDNIGGFLFAGMPMANGSFGPRLYFYSDVNPDDAFGSGPYPLGIVPDMLDFTPETPTTEATINIGSNFNNLGVPGAKSFHLLAPGYGDLAGLGATPPTANPYFIRMASSIAGLTSGGAKGVTFNIPDVTSIPHFTTVPHNPIPLDAATAAFLNSASAYGAYNGGLDATLAFLNANPATLGALFPPTSDMTSMQVATAEIARRKITFSEGAGNAVVILDEDLTDLTGINPALVNIRQATAEDLLVLTASSFIGTEAVPGNPQTVNGVAIPLADKWVLTPEEQEDIAVATEAFNATISTAAQQAGLAFVDANTLLVDVASTGVSFDGFLLQDDLVFGGAFSLDGVHPTARGYAFLANEAIKKINETYNANIPEVKAANYPTFYSGMLP